MLNGVNYKMQNKEDMEFHSKAYRQLVWLYEYLCKQTGEDRKDLSVKSEIENEVNRILIKYDCIPL